MMHEYSVSITVIWARHDLGTKYAACRVLSDRVEFAFFNKNTNYKGVIRVVLPKAEYPDVELLHNGLGFDLFELQLWLRSIEVEEKAEAA